MIAGRSALRSELSLPFWTDPFCTASPVSNPQQNGRHERMHLTLAQQPPELRGRPKPRRPDRLLEHRRRASRATCLRQLRAVQLLRRQADQIRQGRGLRRALTSSRRRPVEVRINRAHSARHAPCAMACAATDGVGKPTSPAEGSLTYSVSEQLAALFKENAGNTLGSEI